MQKILNEDRKTAGIGQKQVKIKPPGISGRLVQNQ